MTSKNPNDVPLNIGMDEEEYAEAKVQRLDILIANERNSATKERYKELRNGWLKKVPKEKIEEKIKEKSTELQETERELSEKERKPDRIMRKAEALKKEKEVEQLKKKRQEILKEIKMIDSALDFEPEGDELQECPICKERLKDPSHPNHIQSAKHQKALKLKEESEQGTD